MARRKRSETHNTSIPEFIDMINTAIAALQSHPTCYPPWPDHVPTVEDIIGQMDALLKLEEGVNKEYQLELHVARDGARHNLKGTLARLIGYLELLLREDSAFPDRLSGCDLWRHPLGSRLVAGKKSRHFDFETNGRMPR